MEHFLAERYVGRATSAALGRESKQIHAATAKLAHVELLQSLHVPSDETCFYLFASDSAELVGRTAELAGVPVERVLPVSVVLPPNTSRQGET